MNKRTLQRAARIYELAVVALMDEGGTETDDETAVCVAAVENARHRLEAMGLHFSEVATLQQCIEAAKR
jgi:hypothetical protein